MQNSEVTQPEQDMELPEDQLQPQIQYQDQAEDLAYDQAFKPTGAIVFFILLIALGILIWFSIYNLQITRH